MSQLRSVLSLATIRRFVQGHIPEQLIIQIHNKCNAHCPQCGMRVSSKIERSKLNPDDIKRIIDAAAARGVRALSFTGGEPLLFLDELVPLITHAQQAGIPFIRTGTNGFLFRNSAREGFEAAMTRLAETLAQTRLYNFWISIDSAVPAVHEEMRGLPGVIAGIEKALPIFHSHGVYPSANLGINRNVGGHYHLEPEGELTMSRRFYETFRRSFQRFYQFVLNLGFTTVNACYPMSIDSSQPGNLQAVYTATSEDNVVNFTTTEKTLLFRALLDTIPEFRSKLRIFTPRSSLYALIRQYSGDEAFPYPCRGGIDFFFIDSADANTYPCGYRGHENLGKFWDPQFKPLDQEPFCKECDWECFRDPSEMAGPLTSLLRSPRALLRRFKADKIYAKLWWQDWRYSYACKFFDGRVPPDYDKLRRWTPPPEMLDATGETSIEPAK
jgi:MoaA/NifB/PqqE/SkfB family radical SAM enzyme